MLHHEEPSQDAVPVSERRITPQQLTRALASIEQRQEAEAQKLEAQARYLAETLPLGPTVRDLGLEVTPEQIWAEVEVQRAAEEAHPVLPSAPPVAEKSAPADPAPATPLPVYHIGPVQQMRAEDIPSPLGAALGGARPVTWTEHLAQDINWNGITPEQEQQEEYEPRTTQTNKAGLKVGLSLLSGGVAFVCFLLWLASLGSVPISQSRPYFPPSTYTQPYFPPPTYTRPYQPLSGMQHPSYSVPPQTLLSQISDNRPIACSIPNISRILNGEPQQNIALTDYEVSSSTGTGKPLTLYQASTWTVVKHDGKVYVRGYAQPENKNAALRGQAIFLFNTSAAPQSEHLVPMTIPVSGADFQGLYQNRTTRFGRVSSPEPDIAMMGRQIIFFSVMHLDKHAYEKWTP